MTEPLDVVLDALRRLAAAREDERQALADVERAVPVWQRSAGVPVTRAGDALRTAMVDAGWSEEQLSSLRLPLSNPRLRIMIDQDRKQRS